MRRAHAAARLVAAALLLSTSAAASGPSRRMLAAAVGGDANASSTPLQEFLSFISQSNATCLSLPDAPSGASHLARVHVPLKAPPASSPAPSFGSALQQAVQCTAQLIKSLSSNVGTAVVNPPPPNIIFPNGIFRPIPQFPPFVLPLSTFVDQTDSSSLPPPSPPPSSPPLLAGDSTTAVNAIDVTDALLAGAGASSLITDSSSGSSNLAAALVVTDSSATPTDSTTGALNIAFGLVGSTSSDGASFVLAPPFATVARPNGTNTSAGDAVSSSTSTVGSSSLPPYALSSSSSFALPAPFAAVVGPNAINGSSINGSFTNGSFTNVSATAPPPLESPPGYTRRTRSPPPRPPPPLGVGPTPSPIPSPTPPPPSPSPKPPPPLVSPPPPLASPPPNQFFVSSQPAAVGISYSSPNPTMDVTQEPDGSIPVYLIWYGAWGAESGANTYPTQTIVPRFFEGMSGSNYWAVSALYYDTAGNVASKLRVAGQINVPNTVHGVNITNNDVTTLVTTSLSTGSFPAQSNAIYYVLTSPEVLNTNGFCTSFCGFHSYLTTSSNAVIKFAFVGSPGLCPSVAGYSSCGVLTQSQSPNGNSNADNMVSIIAHETSEIVTDPQLNAWYSTSNGEENGDLCAWNFGSTTTVGGRMSNVLWNGYSYLIQQIWQPFKGACALSP